MGSKLFRKVVRAYAAGEIVFEQGSEADGIYSIQTGRVSVYKLKPSPSGPVEVELAQLGPGSMFGEMGMLDGSTRDASVKAVEFTEAVIITKDMFESQMAVLPAWIVNFIKILIGRLRSTNDRLAAALRRLEDLEPRRDPGADPAVGAGADGSDKPPSDPGGATADRPGPRGAPAG